MSVSLVIFIIIHLFVFAFFTESLRRTAYRAREYSLEEKRTTLPFGFIRLKHIVFWYILTYIAWVIFSLWLYSVFVGDVSLIPKGIRTPGNNILNL
jgi:hypothetical protein